MMDKTQAQRYQVVGHTKSQLFQGYKVVRQGTTNDFRMCLTI